MIKAVIFDCFGVLTVDTWREYTEGLNKDIYHDAKSITHAYDSGLISEESLIEKFSQLTGHDKKIISEAIKPKSSKNNKLLEYIKLLKTQGYKTGILSNINNNWITSEFLNKQEINYFDQIVMSFQIGFAKPDHEMYKKICQLLSVNPNECVFIDDVESYCKAAEDLGMQSIVYKNFGDMKHQVEEIIE